MLRCVYTVYGKCRNRASVLIMTTTHSLYLFLFLVKAFFVIDSFPALFRLEVVAVGLTTTTKNRKRGRGERFLSLLHNSVAKGGEGPLSDISSIFLSPSSRTVRSLGLVFFWMAAAATVTENFFKDRPPMESREKSFVSVSVSVFLLSPTFFWLWLAATSVSAAQGRGCKRLTKY